MNAPYVNYPMQVARPTMPGRLKAARVLLIVVAAGTVLLVVGVAAQAASSEAIGEEIGRRAGLPLVLGLVGLVLALRIRAGGRGVRVGINLVEVAWILFAVGQAGQGDPTALPALILPIVILTLVNGRSAGRHFRPKQPPNGPHPIYGYR